MKTLNSNQQAAVDSGAKQIVCLAGAGSGKTTTLVARLVRLIKSGVDHCNINSGVDPREIVVVTFTNAAAKELQSRLAKEIPDAKLGYCGTLHGFCLRLLQKYGTQIDLAENLTVVAQEQGEEIVERIVKRLKYKGSAVDIKKAMDQGEYSYRGRDTTLSKSERVAAAYFMELREANLVDFDTILGHAEYLLTLLNADLRYKYIFVDEAQDCSRQDFNIYRLLSARVPNFFYVGDPNQAIYGFRGGSVDDFIKLAQSDKTALFRIEENYRCDRIIAEAAQRVIGNNPGDLITKTISATGRDGEIGCDISDKEFGEVFKLINLISGYQLTTGIPFKNMAVLVRTNALAQKLAKGLEGNGIPIARKAALNLPSDWRKAMMLLSLVGNPENDLLARSWIELTQGILKADCVAFEALSNYKSINQTYLRFPPFTDTTALVDFMARQHISLESLDRIAQAEQSLGFGATLADVIIELGKSIDHRDEIGDGVTVTTYHSAKGREWTVVFLPAFEQGIMPLGNANIAEERRLAYVALTRARSFLHISYVRERTPEFKYKPEPMSPSQFILEMAGEYGLPREHRIK